MGNTVVQLLAVEGCWNAFALDLPFINFLSPTWKLFWRTAQQGTVE